MAKVHHAGSFTTPGCGLVAAINSWNSDVAMVNNFLNTPPTTGTDYANFASFTLGFANDEPNELTTLASIPALSTDATNAIQDLRAVFGRVLTNLQDIINNQNDLTIIKQDITNINQVRCCNVLPNLNVLWTAAADAEGVSNLVNLVVPNENACAAINC
jgi:hypothetical protein